MSHVLEQLREKQQSFAVSPFVTFLQDSYFTARMRLGFLPCLAPFVMGLPDFGRTLEGGAPRQDSNATQEAGPHWERYQKDLQTLGFEGASDFASTLGMLWGEDGSEARAVLQELIDLATRASPMQRQVVRLALQAVSNVMLRALEQIARDLKACTGKQLVSLESLRTVGVASPGAVELDLSPEAQFEARQLVREVFALFNRLGDHLLEYVQRQMEVEKDPLGWERTSSLTFHEFGSSRLRALCESVGYGTEQVETVQRYFSAMCDGWGHQHIGSSPRWLSEITDDHTPYEFSMAMEDGEPEVRFLIEAQNNPTSLESSWEDGLMLAERLHHQFGVPLERFNLVKDLYEPRNPEARFSLWYAFGLKDGKTPGVKAYFNPRAQGDENAKSLVQESLARLGFANAWRFISEVAMNRGDKDQLVFFSLDLSAHRAARIKVYVARQDANAEEIEKLMSHAKEYVPGEATEFYRRLQGAEGRFSAPRATQVCLSFTSDDDARPTGIQLYVPIRCYAQNDLDAMARIRSVVEPSRYAMLDMAVQSIAHRPLESGVGLIQWAAMRREGGKIRTTFYLATEAYCHAAARTLVPEASFFLPSDSGSGYRALADA